VSPELESVHWGPRPAGAGDKRDRFDAQAALFEGRAGLPADVARSVARAVLEMTRPEPDDLLVELGAGTGQIGQHLIESIRYIGIDRSEGMLEVFRKRLGRAAALPVRLSHADADGPWPVGDGSVAVVFASRVAHLLDPEHLVAELRRIFRPGGYFIVGRLSREPDALKSRLRRQRRLLLRQEGLAPRDLEQATERVIERLLSWGARRVQARQIATWTVSASVQEVLAEWKAVGAVGGHRLDATSRARILAQLERWAADELGDLRTRAIWEERYVLEGARTTDG
jgi:SAM-dependent methyltransferase